MSTQTEPSAQVRDALGDRVRRVQASGQTLTLTVDGRADSALVTLEMLTATGLAPVGAWGIRQAREEWAQLRTAAAEQGPQIITDRGTPVVALVSAEHARLIAQGLPVLEAAELRFDGHQITDQDGRIIAPGTYSYVGGVLHVPAPDADGDGHDR
ncbi:type II toxin-antitoxin system prevent-host-death family antitoxin [Nocardiopsis changdeensis]|uniref:Type II toxin-antitoxin system prevent-host-death family antitoxin n=1 Tax=Nocardiopsis changdeensis TaxID=2831969 RepID=A0A975KSU9_9ACTN|nr:MULTISPECIES: type II toxin-antitoxin system prevent-host-death family antitoxin [Nocardiopsis]QUX26506.1 type II toxin-antitoxin system prevent-host-death family antitoxin [Nocardiopsis changdeensis]QYX40778.1 type II toxin-antitoxin system prevent-host-death family antitoxin [Nocardiopsis sp. MT53]